MSGLDANVKRSLVDSAVDSLRPWSALQVGARMLLGVAITAIVAVSFSSARTVLRYPNEVVPTPTELVASCDVVATGVFLDPSWLPLPGESTTLPLPNCRVAVERLHAGVLTNDTIRVQVVPLLPSGLVTGSRVFVYCNRVEGQRDNYVGIVCGVDRHGDLVVGMNTNPMLARLSAGNGQVPLARVLSDSLLEMTLSRRMAHAAGVGLFRVRARIPGRDRRACFAIDSLGWLAGEARSPKEVTFDFHGACESVAAVGDTLVLPVPGGDVERLAFSSCSDVAKVARGSVRYLGIDPILERGRLVRRGGGFTVGRERAR